MKPKLSQDAQIVLEAKFVQAHSLVDFYEKNVRRLRFSIYRALSNQCSTADLRKLMFDFNEEIVTTGTATSLIVEDHARVVEQNGVSYRRRVDAAYIDWETHRSTIVQAEARPLTSDDERSTLSQFGLGMCHMLALGIEPVRKLRDYYRDCISPGRIAAKKRGRKRVPKLVGRNHDIYEEFTRMPGGKGVKYVSLGKKHDREPDTIRKIVGQVGKSIRKSGNK